jgi:hypothetical protein
MDSTQHGQQSSSNTVSHTHTISNVFGVPCIKQQRVICVSGRDSHASELNSPHWRNLRASLYSAFKYLMQNQFRGWTVFSFWHSDTAISTTPKNSYCRQSVAQPKEAEIPLWLNCLKPSNKNDITVHHDKLLYINYGVRMWSSGCVWWEINLLKPTGYFKYQQV